MNKQQPKIFFRKKILSVFPRSVTSLLRRHLDANEKDEC